MDSAATATHRTVALIGGAGSGKTTLAEALLHRAGELSRAGSVEQGNTVCDHEPEEIARGMTLGLSLALLRWSDPDGVEHTLTLADTPGHPDFVGGVDTALSVADVALVAVSAVDGVTAGTRFAWAAAEAAGVPRIVVVTQEDKARADFRRVLGELQAAFGEGLWALELPLGEEQAFHGIADVLSEQALEYDDGRPPPRRPDAGRRRGRGAPDARRRDRGDRVARRRPARGVPRRATSRRPPSSSARSRGEVATGEAVPVIVCSGVTGTGVDRVADLLCSLAPVVRSTTTAASSSAARRTARAAPSTASRRSRRRDPPAGVPHRGRPVRRAGLDVQGPLGRRAPERPAAQRDDRRRRAHPRAVPAAGPEHLPVDALRAGEVGAVAKLTGSPSGSLLWTRANGTARPAPQPRARAGVRSEPRAGHAVRRREAHVLARPARRRGPDARDRPHRRRTPCCADSATRTSRSRSSASRACSACT